MEGNDDMAKAIEASLKEYNKQEESWNGTIFNKK